MPVPRVRAAFRLASLALLAPVFITPNAVAAVTQKQAEKRAISALGLEKGSKPVVLFRKSTVVPQGTKIREAGPTSSSPKRSAPARGVLRKAGVQVVTAPVVLTASGEAAWFFYEDQAPYQAYEHPGRVALVGRRSGRVRLSKVIDWPPLIGTELPSFLASFAAYRDPKYRAFARAWTVTPGATTSAARAARANAKTTPTLPSTLASTPEAIDARREAARLLVDEGSCAIRISDTLGDFFDAGPVDATRAALGAVLHELALANPGFFTAWYRTTDGTPAQSVAKAIKEHGCRDVLIYLAGAGTEVGDDPAINVGLNARRDGKLERQLVTATALRKLMGENPSVTFKIEVDAPKSGAFIAAIQGTPNLLLSASSTGGKGGSFTALGDVVNAAGTPVPNTYNPNGLMEFTNRQITGLGCFLSRPDEVAAGARAKSEGRTKSFLAWMLARAFAICGDGYLADQVDDAPAPPKLQLTFSAPTDLDLNRAPVASDLTATTDEDTPVSLTLPATDSDGNALTFAVVDAPAHGTVSTGTGATRTYTPAANYSGDDQFTFTASDGRATTAKTTVKITVKPVNDAPVLTLGTGTTTFTEAGAAVRVDPDLTVTDVDDDRLTGATVAIGAGFDSGSDTLAFTAQAGITGSYDAAAGVLTLTGDATVADYQSVLQSVTFSNPGSALSSATRQVVFRANDGDVFGASADRPVVVSVVDDAPVLAGGGNAATYVEDSATGELVAPAATVTDVDSPNLESATARITTGLVAVEDRLTFTAQPGITGTFDTSTGVLSLTGAASLADYQAVLRSVRYRNANTADPSTATRTIELQVDDGPELSNTVSGTVAVTAVNDAPTVNASGASPAFTEGGTAVAVDPSLTVADIDGTVIVSATATITTGHDAADDVLAFPATPGLTASFNTGSGTLTITGNATPSAYETALRTVTYANTDTDDPSGTTRTVQFVVDDGQAANHASIPADAPVQVTPVNDAPVLSNGGNTVTFTEDDATGVLVNSGLGVSDVDSATLASAAVQITTAYNGAEDRLVFTDQNGITGAFDTSTGVLALTGTASVADYRTALRSIRYRNVNGNAPSTTQRVVTFTVNDGAASSNASNSVLSSVDINPQNDPPSLTAGGASPTFAEGGSPVVVDPAVVADDVDSANLASATVQITVGLDTGDDRLVFTNTASITGVYTAATGTLALSGSDTVANYQAALRSVTYRNLDTDNPSTTARTVSFTASDASLVSNTVGTTVNVTAVNDAPLMTASPGSAAFVEDAGAVAVDPGLVFTDVDDANFSGATATISGSFIAGQDTLTFADTATITGSWDASTATLTLAGTDTVAAYQAALRTVRFANSSHTPNTTTRTVAFAAADSGPLPVSATRTVTVAAANDAPTLLAGGGAPTWTEGGPAVVVDPAVQVSDLDGDNLTGANVSVTGNWSASDRLNFTNQLGITGSFNTGSGVLTLTGTTTTANYQTALRTITFSNVSGQPSTADRTIGFTVSDASLTSAAVSTTVDVISTNSAPTLGAGGNTLAYTEDDAATSINTAITAADSDDTDLEGATVQLTTGYDNTEDELTFANTASITGSWSSITGVLTLSGTDTVAGYQAALRAVKYVNNDHVVPSTAPRTASFVANDGEVDSVAVTSTITVAAANDAPTLTAGTGNTHTFTEDGSAVTVDDAIVASDPDDANLAGATVSITTGFSSAQGDTLAFTDQNGITGSYTAGTGVLALTGSSTVANYQAALRSISFSNTSQAPTTSRTVSFTVSDGTATSGAVTHAVTIQPVNDAPTLGGGGTLAYTENDPATAISPALTATDPDTSTVAVATVSIGFSTSQDELSFTNTANISGSYSSLMGTLTLTGVDTVANYQAALRSVKYRNTSDNPTTTARTLTYSLSDGALSGSTSATVNVTAINDAPVAADVAHSAGSSAIGNTAFVVDDPTDGAPDPAGPQKTITGDLLAGATDADSSGLSIVAGTFASNDGGSVTIQADGDYVFTPAVSTSCADHSDFVDYTLTDDASTPATDTGRITFAITDCVWYVQNNAAAGGNGASGTPYDTLDEADDAASAAGDFLYVYKGDGTTTGLVDGDGVSLLASQRFVGGAEPLTVAGTTLETGNNANRPSIVANVNLGSGNVVEGLGISPTLGWGISGGAGDAGGTLDDLTLGATGTGGGLELLATSGTWNISDLTASTVGDALVLGNAGSVNLTSAGTISLASSAGRGLTASGTGTTLSGTVDSVTTTASPTTGISLTDTAGSLTIDDVNVTSTGTGLFLGNANAITVNNSGDATITSSGTAVDLNTDTATAVTTQPSVSLGNVSSSGGARGLRINDVAGGTFTASGGTLSGQTTTAVDITNGTGNISYAGTIGNGTGASAQISGRTAGTITLSGNINDNNDLGGGVDIGVNPGGTTVLSGSTKTLNTTTQNAITFAPGVGSTHALQISGGGLDLDTTSGAGLSAAGGGTLSVTGSANSITATAGPAVVVNGPDFAGSDATFQSISSANAGVGIVLTDTGSAGGLHVTGTGAAGSGGTITGASGPGINLTNTSELQLASVNVTNGGDDGIRGVGVSGFQLTASANVTGNGNAVGEHGIDLTELSGTVGNPVVLTNATVTGNFENNLSIVNDASTISSLSVTGGSYGSNSATSGNDGIHLENTGTGDLTGATISGANFTNNRGDHIQVVTDNSNTADQNVTISTNTLRGTGNQPGNTMLGGGIAIGAGGNATQKVTVNNNDIERPYGSAISLNTSSLTTPTVGWTVTNNTIGTSGEVNSGSQSNSGIYGNVNGDGTANVLIQNNTIYRTDFTHVDIVQNDGDADLSLTMKGNQLLQGGDTAADYIYGVRLVFGSDATDTGTNCLDMGATSPAGDKNSLFGLDPLNVDLRVRFAGGPVQLKLVGYAGGSTDDAAVKSYLQSRNDGNGTPTANLSRIDPGASYSGAASCPLP